MLKQDEKNNDYLRVSEKRREKNGFEISLNECVFRLFHYEYEKSKMILSVIEKYYAKIYIVMNHIIDLLTPVICGAKEIYWLTWRSRFFD